MDNYAWRVSVEYRPGVAATFIYVGRKVTPNTREFLVKGGEEVVTIDPTTAQQTEEVYFARFEDDHIGSLIVEALDKRGIKAPSQSYIEGKYEATSDHLKDLRKLIPKLEETE